jgi:uncharacterized membrane protein YczE
MRSLVLDPPTDRLARRVISLATGLVLFGVSVALLVAGGLGLDPWDVFQQGLADRLHIPFGLGVIGIGVLVLLLWIPLRQRPGFGTLSNVIVVGLVIDATLPLLPTSHLISFRITYLVAGVLLNAVATGLYIGAGMGPGPRDGLMTGLAAKGISIRVARSAVELSVLAAGWLLGGTVGVGTLVYALSIGPLVQILLPRLAVAAPSAPSGH